ncbi:DUF123 domain-containing protein [Candidatus Poribacteria bacterium]|nr:DUF123 domain-containing protein [Candidatus Poribacteria bacterium]
MTPGVYNLIIQLPETREIQVGKLGKFTFPVGYYVYTGSALRGLESRINRHLRKEKKLHWHIDYLLQYTDVIDVIAYETKERLECKVNQYILSLPDSRIIAKGFGSSDCNCLSHLIYFKNNVILNQEHNFAQDCQ